jgi:hypothetical protein
MSIKVLADEFKEKYWKDYLSYCKKVFNSLPNEMKSLLNNIDLPEDIKIVLIVKLKNNAKNWIYERVPALENKRPFDLLSNDYEIKALKGALLRMPD